MTIELNALKVERDRIKVELRELELQQRKLEAELKAFRQREVQSKRQIDALSTLIELGETPEKAADAKDGG